MSSYERISIAEAEQMIEDSNTLLLDMRDYLSYLNGHHPKALHLNDQNLRLLLKQAARHIPVLIYCYHGNSSQDMAQLFSDFGFTSCYSVDGGYEAWFQKVKHPAIDLSESLTEWMEMHNYDPDNIDLRGSNNETALMRAAREAAVAECEELLKAGANPNLKNQDGNNALWMACYSESEAIIDLLVEYGADVNNQNDNGATALIYTASAGKLNMVKKLLAHGANASLVTLDDFSALDVAATIDILRLLKACHSAKKKSESRQGIYDETAEPARDEKAAV